MHILNQMEIQTSLVDLIQSEVQKPWMKMTKMPSGVSSNSSSVATKAKTKISYLSRRKSILRSRERLISKCLHNNVCQHLLIRVKFQKLKR